MRTLHPALRVADAAASLAFYSALGYAVVGRVPGTSLGDLVLLKLDQDEFAAIELVVDPGARRDDGSALSHLAVQVDSLDEAVAALAAAGFDPGPVRRPGGEAGPRTAWAADPDGHRIELTEWPPGHAAGIGTADFA
jgi:lactoylglutathione lyase